MRNKTVLVIEDTPLNMELVSDLLELNGYDVLQAKNAEVGIELARTKNPDIILMDISLPGMDGLKATRILRKDPLTRFVPVIALTANAMKGDDQKALDAGCAGFISKPIDTRRFVETLDGFIRSLHD